jgi:GrpB-like predicted nucleotidyltransferase (UPF0157 family)
MAAVRNLRQGQDLARLLSVLGYECARVRVDRNRHEKSPLPAAAFRAPGTSLPTSHRRAQHLGTAEGTAYARLSMLAHPEAAAAYDELKKRLAEEHTGNSLAYTRAKTAFIQDLIDKARAELGLPSIDVWAD